MKAKKITKKLLLNKMTITNLGNPGMNAAAVRGGALTSPLVGCAGSLYTFSCDLSCQCSTNQFCTTCMPEGCP